MVIRPLHVVLIGLLIGLAAVNVVMTHDLLTEPYPGHNDFMSRWEGVRAFWRDGLNPYSDEASRSIQEQIYGRAARADEDPGYFAYPFYVVFLLAPLAYVSYAWASALWMVLLEIALIAALILLLDLFRWRPKPWLLAVLLVWVLIQYFPARGLILGQPGHLVYFFQVLALWALANGRDRLAGVALALATIKPQMGYLLVPFLLLWAWRMRRWRVIASFGVLWGVLMACSFFVEPGWLEDWITQVQRYPSYTAIGAPVWVVTQHYLGLGDVGEWVVNLMFYGLVLWGWYQVLVRRRAAMFDWVVMVTITVTHLCAIRTATPHYVVFLLPLVFYFRWMAQQRRGELWIVAILAILFVVPWVHFLLTVNGEFEHPTLYLYAFGVAGLLWYTRELWWATPGMLAARSRDLNG